MTGWVVVSGGKTGTDLLRTSRDHRDCQQLDVSPRRQECPLCHQPLTERYRQQRWIIQRDQQVKVVSHGLEGCHTEGDQRAVVYRPDQEAAFAVRGHTVGLDGVARIGELRDRENLAITKIQEHRKSASHLVISIKAGAWLCEVFLAWVTTVARPDAALIEQVRRGGGMVLAMEGVQPETSQEPLYMVRDVRSGRVFVAQTWLSSATAELELLSEEVLS